MSPYDMWVAASVGSTCRIRVCEDCKDIYNTEECPLREYDAKYSVEEIAEFIKMVTDKLRNLQKAADDSDVELELTDVDWRQLFNDAVDLIE